MYQPSDIEVLSSVLTRIAEALERIAEATEKDDGDGKPVIISQPEKT